MSKLWINCALLLATEHSPYWCLTPWPMKASTDSLIKWCNPRHRGGWFQHKQRREQRTALLWWGRGPEVTGQESSGKYRMPERPCRVTCPLPWRSRTDMARGHMCKVKRSEVMTCTKSHCDLIWLGKRIHVGRGGGVKLVRQSQEPRKSLWDHVSHCTSHRFHIKRGIYLGDG